MSTLLKEIHLDMAGLTAEGATNEPAPMQSAFWLVDGYYQSYETSVMEVELGLSVQRILGTRKQVFLRERPGQALFQKAKTAIDSRLNEKSAFEVPTRTTEVKAQLGEGKELAKFDPAMGLIWVARFQSVGRMSRIEAQEQAARDRRRMEEAIRAFETVLLLDPGHREGRMCLAACFRHYTIGRLEEARNYYRDLIENPVQDRWSDAAQKALVNSFEWDAAETRVRWFNEAAGQATNSVSGTFYRQQAKQAEEDFTIRHGDRAKAEELAEGRLLEALKAWEQSLNAGAYIIDFDNTGLGDFAQSFGTNKADAARTLVALMPKLQKANPNLAPHIMAGVVSFQVDTNAAIITEFERSLDDWNAHPEAIFKADYFFSLLSGPLYYWSTRRGLHGLTARVLEGRDRLARQKKATPLDDEKRMALAFACMKVERWTNALEIFLSYSNRPVFMGNRGLWGPAFTVVLTSKQTANCRSKLGLPEQRDPREFSLEEPALPIAAGGLAFADPDGLWIALSDRLMRLDFDLRTNKTLSFPNHPLAAINCVVEVGSSLWLGTDGAGLFEFDKLKGEFRHLTQDDGLLMNSVTHLAPSKDALWIGYGTQNGGGLGKLDLPTRKVTSYSRSIFPASAQPSASGGSPPEHGQPPKRAVRALVVGADDDVWFTESSVVRRFRSRSDAWEDFSQPGGCYTFALTKDNLFAGRFTQEFSTPLTGFLGVNIMDLPSNSWRRLPAVEGLPHDLVTALVYEGGNLWVGGLGFVALLDPERAILKKYAYVPTRSVDRIQKAGGYLWVEFNGQLHRALLSRIN